MNPKDTFPGKIYAVTSPNGCTVTTEDGLTLAEIEAGKQGYFVAVSGHVTLSDNAAILTPLFKLAPQQRLAILGVLGGNAGGLPAGFKRVEWLESNGTQYIDTGVLPGNYDEIRYTAQLRTSSYNMAFAAIGVQKRNNRENGSVEYMRYNTDTSLYFVHYNGQSTFLYGTRADGCVEKHNFIYNNGHAYGDFVIEQTWTPETRDIAEATYYVFARNNSGVQYPYEGRIYEISITDEGVEKLHFIPCLDATGAPCMYDLATRQPFYNSGSGDFLYPTESTTYSLRRVLPDWGKLTENGLRRLYHAPAGYHGELIDYALENGYKPIVETEQPEEGYWAPRWRETEDEIVLEWVETEPPMEELGMPEETSTETE